MLGLRTAHTVEKTQLQTEDYLVQLQVACGRGVSCPPRRNFHLDSGWFVGCPVALGVKNSPANAGDNRDMGLISGLGRSPGGGHDNPLQYSCLENPMDRGAWWATVHGLHRIGHNRSELAWMHACIGVVGNQPEEPRLHQGTMSGWRFQLGNE